MVLYELLDVERGFVWVLGFHLGPLKLQTATFELLARYTLS